MPGDLIAVHIVSAVLHAYTVVWLLELGPRRARLRAPARRGRPDRAQRRAVPRERPAGAVTAVTARRERVPGEAGLVLRDGAALLPARGRVDLWLELDEPVTVLRPASEPVHVRRLAIASDEPAELARMLLEPAPRPQPEPAHMLGALPAGFAADALREALQPA